jgi:OmcA/MtrC family decaheme c-type cytochrome
LAYGSGKRTIPFSWHRDKVPSDPAGFNAASVVYPGILKRCENCHVPNAVNFGASGSTLLPNLLWSTSGTGKYNATADTVKAYPRDPVTGLVTYITADNVVNYGNVMAFTPQGSVVASATDSAGVVNPLFKTIAGAGGVTIPADLATLVESPVTSACFACHDSSTAKLHMGQYGGVMYGTRAANGGATLVNRETCLVCHGMGRDQDAAVVHAK